ADQDRPTAVVSDRPASGYRHGFGAGEGELLLAAGDDAQHRAPIEPKMRRRSRAHRLSGRRLIQGEILWKVARVATQHVVGVQLIGLAAKTADGLQAIQEV